MTQTAPFLHGKPLSQFAFTWASGRHQYIACVPRRLMARSRLTGTILLLCVVTQWMLAQKSEPAATANLELGGRIAQAVRVDHAPRLDGTLEDPIWQQAPTITDSRPERTVRQRSYVTVDESTGLFGQSAAGTPIGSGSQGRRAKELRRS